MAERFTAPLAPNEQGLPPETYADGSVGSDGYRLCELVETYWLVKGKPLRLDDWQRQLLIRILERCPPGHPRAGQLRYRQVVVSIPRQAGKSLLAAVLSLYGLLQHCHAPRVLGVARSVTQANIVYGYTADAIRQSDGLSGVLSPTGTRGISQTNGLGSYKVLPAKVESIQGYESTLSICDELHVMDPRIWDAIVESQRAQIDPLLIGITTAGDITSVLLKRLYEQGDAAIAGAQETFGFFVWEANSDELTLEAITEANPAVACGRISAQTILDDCKGQPPSQWKRYTLNTFIAGLAEPWINPSDWAKCGGTGLEDFKDAIISFEPSDRMGFVSIYAAKKIDGVIKTALVARLVAPNLDTLKDVADRLYKATRCTFVMDARRLRALVEYLDDKQRNPIRMFPDRKAEAASMVYGLVMAQTVEHDAQPDVAAHHRVAVLKRDTIDGKEVDMAIASVYAIYAAEIQKKKGVLMA